MKLIERDLFVIKLLRENAMYLVGFGVLVITFILSLFFFSMQYEATKGLIESNTAELNKLKNKASFAKYRNELVSAGVDIDQMNQIFNQLLPETEDYFSIIVALEKLSVQTNFIITSYVINLKESTSEKLSLSVHGQGDANSFLQFLKDYNFAGARLITIDKISFNRLSLAGIELQANFYNQKAKLDQGVESAPLTAQDKALIDTVKSKVFFEIKPEESTEVTYPVKSNPF